MAFFSLLLAFLFINSQQEVPTQTDRQSLQQQASLRREHDRQEAIQINDLAGHIQSEADALALVDKIAEAFSDSLPPIWVTHAIRERVAHAEYQAVSDPLKTIPEQRIVDVWNSYVREIGAPEEALVTVAEIHNLRDAQFATSQLLWQEGMFPTIWSVPGIYAIGSEGKLAEGCRAVEALRIFYDLDQRFENLRGARERAHKGVLASEAIKKRLENPPQNQKSVARLVARVDTNPIRVAEYRYMQEHGPYILSSVVLKLFDELFPRSE